MIEKPTKLSFRSILLTGGTGSFGKTFVRKLLYGHPEVKRIVIFSRDELKQFELAHEFPVSQFPQMRYFIGDVRDEKRLERAMEGIDVVVHAAALKQVPVAEYNPMEAISTNVLGAENVINAALSSGVKRVVALSTDKAAAPVNLYGATKLCADKLFCAANNIVGKRNLRFAVVRYGNVIGSRGSVVPFFLEHRKKGFLPITHKEMTRFNITLEEGVNMVLYAIENTWGGEIYVPKIPSFLLTDLATAIGPGLPQKIVGIRPGEKLHEEMITPTDSFNTLEFSNYYVILPATPQWDTVDFAKKFKGKKVKEGFHYTSASNKKWLKVKDLRKLIRDHVDPNF